MAETGRVFARRDNIFKSWKLTAEDWRNREKWPQYTQAVEDMLAKTNTKDAPWFVIANEDKLFGRIQVMENIIDHLKTRLSK